MKISKSQLRRIIRESLPYRKGQPWTDPKAPVGVDRTEDDLDKELTDEEIEAAEGWEPADPAGDSDFWAGYGDAANGLGLPVGASPDYKAGWEDGSMDHVTESIGHSKIKITKRQLRKIIKEATVSKLSEGLQYHVSAGVGIDQNIYRPGSKEFFRLFVEARNLYNRGGYKPKSIAEYEILEFHDIGEFDIYDGDKVPLDFPMNEIELDEAKYKGREVTLGAQGAQKGDGGKSYVYVKDPDSGKVKKVSFGSSMKDAMGDNEEDKKARKNFGSRHACSKKKDKLAPGYWSCRATKMFGRDIPGWW